MGRLVGWVRRRGTTLAFAVLVGLNVAGFVSVQRLQHRACEDGNELRREHLPAAFDMFSRRLGHRLGADPAEIDEFVVGFDGELHDLFPPTDC